MHATRLGATYAPLIAHLHAVIDKLHPQAQIDQPFPWLPHSLAILGGAGSALRQMA